MSSDRVFPCEHYKGRQDELCLTCGWGRCYRPTVCLGFTEGPPRAPRVLPPLSAEGNTLGESLATEWMTTPEGPSPPAGSTSTPA